MVRVNQSYLDDLIDLIGTGTVHSHYITVIKALYDTEFICNVDEDINRLADARELRIELQGPVNRPISLLEVMIALAKRCHEEIMYGYLISKHELSSTAYWFWTMMHNCGLDQLGEWNLNNFSDDFYAIVNPILNRTYNYNGTGGFFPLHHPEMDQRFCELWYQMNAYLLENYPF